MNNKAPSLKELEQIFQKHGFEDYKWIQSKDIVVSNWVRMKCVYGCSDYGKCATCPPNNPPVSECREFFDEYSDIVVFHFEVELKDPEDRHAIMAEIGKKLLGLEKEVFLSGYEKTFILPPDSCALCRECVSAREDCKHPKLARPPPEALAVDVFTTVRTVGYPIDVLKDYRDTMNRYAFLLVR